MANFISSVKFKSGVPLTYNPRRDLKNILLTSIFDGSLKSSLSIKKANPVAAKKADKISKRSGYDYIDLKSIKHLRLEMQRDILAKYLNNKPANTKNIYALNMMGNTCLGLEKYGEASNYFRQILNYLPGDIQALNGVGKAAFFMGKYAEAESIFNKNPDDIMSLAWLRRLRYVQNRVIEADLIYEKIKSLKATDTHALNEIGKISYFHRDFTLSKYCFIRLLELVPDDIPAMDMLAQIAIKLKYYEAAHKLCRQILEIDETDKSAIRTLEFLRGKI